ncbi:histone acetyltransferase HAC1-like [Chenopodium quinoa]|uniref:histone acetyltransferase HAC1-like n=1 Tax=Chenopodium quinoa TaxID=63459 RepID=UPI000B7894B3|nr:histone acetyltransferase HAC1-like [Chenopodium quinoa]XP_021729470.1 histone acetyltransferase HAC1-like [Chenopodium quinoa]
MTKDILLCTHCGVLMLSGHGWVCKQCANFQLCGKCYEVEQKQDKGERHPTNQKDKHALYPVEVNYVPNDTNDKDVIVESEDSAPAAVTTCNICHLDIAINQVWRCVTCQDFDVCNPCFQKDESINHPHKLTNQPSMAHSDAQNQEARQRVLQLNELLDLLVHATKCHSLDRQCEYPNCLKTKGMIRHGMQCRTRAEGGCVHCRKMWYLLRLHAQFCNDSECHVPRCRDLKERLSSFKLQDLCI